MKKYLEVGRICGTHALKGEVRVEAWADSPEFLCSFKNMYFDEGQKKLKVKGARVHKNIVILKIEGINSIEEADVLRGKVLYIDRNDVQLEEGRYFVQDLIGLKLIDADNGTEYGEICEVSSTYANDIYHIKRNDDKIDLIPAIDDVIAETNIEEGYVKIHRMKGMFDDED